MLQEIKLTVRHLWRKKVYTSIILLSLIIGFSCANLLLSFLVAELSTDNFHPEPERTFQLLGTDPFEHKGNIAFIPDYLKDYLTRNFHEVERVCGITDLPNATVEASQGNSQSIQLLSTDSSFFSLFGFALIAGNHHHNLSPESIILTKTKAEALFGQSDPVGKRLTLKLPDTARILTVAGIIDKAPENSHLVFEALIAHEVLINKWKGGATYVQLKPNVQAKALERKINDDKNRPGLLGPGSIQYFMKPLTNAYFEPANKMPYMKTRTPFFMKVGYFVCGLILFMASFNFANLFLLSLQERGKETGIKKTLGITFSRLLKSSFTEILIYILVAFSQKT